MGYDYTRLKPKVGQKRIESILVSSTEHVMYKYISSEKNYNLVASILGKVDVGVHASTMCNIKLGLTIGYRLRVKQS